MRSDEYRNLPGGTARFISPTRHATTTSAKLPGMAQFSLKRLMLAMAFLGVALGYTAWFIRSIPPGHFHFTELAYITLFACC